MSAGGTMPRRALLRGMAALPLAAGLGAKATAPALDAGADVGAVARALDEVMSADEAYCQQIEMATFDGQAVEASLDALTAAGLRFAATPARTLKDLVIKLRYIEQDVTLGKTVWTEDLVRSALADAERLASSRHIEPSGYRALVLNAAGGAATGAQAL